MLKIFLVKEIKINLENTPLSRIFGNISNMKKFIMFFIVWIASNLSIPFWAVGHIHLTMNVYKDIYEILASVGMNILVATGFWIEWKKHKKENYEQ